VLDAHSHSQGRQNNHHLYKRPLGFRREAWKGPGRVLALYYGLPDADMVMQRRDYCLNKAQNGN
jgi:hypothetical protein